MTNELDDELSAWGRSSTPPIDGAFANRLETSLRSEIVAGEPVRGRWGLAAVMRPSVLVLGAMIAIGAAVYLSADADDEGLDFAGSTPTTPIDATPVDPVDTQTTTAPTSQAPTTVASTTAPDSTGSTSAPTTTTPTTPAPTTSAASTSAVPTDVVVALSVRADGRQLIASWTLRGDEATIAGWVLVRSIDDRSTVVATSRDVDIRTFTVPVTDRAHTIRVEGRSAGGGVVVASDDVPVNPGE
jgi:hypothetical protein